MCKLSMENVMMSRKDVKVNSCGLLREKTTALPLIQGVMMQCDMKMS